MPEIYTSEIQFKRGTKEQLENHYLSGENIPSEGEPIFNLDNGNLKIGDGHTNYFQLTSVYENGLKEGGFIYTPQMFGAKADCIGSHSAGTDDSLAFIKCFWQVDENGEILLNEDGTRKTLEDKRDVYVPAGSYKIEHNIDIPSGGRIILHPAAILKTTKNNCMFTLNKNSHLIGGNLQSYFSNKRIKKDENGNSIKVNGQYVYEYIFSYEELLPLVRIGRRNKEVYVSNSLGYKYVLPFEKGKDSEDNLYVYPLTSKGNLSNAKISYLYTYKQGHVGPCVSIEAGGIIKYQQNGVENIYYRETYFCNISNVYLGGGAVGVDIKPAPHVYVDSAWKEKGWNNNHFVHGMLYNDRHMWIRGGGNIVDIAGQADYQSTAEDGFENNSCIVIEDSSNSITANIYDVGNEGLVQTLVEVVKGTGNTLNGYLGSSGYVMRPTLKGDIINTKENYPCWTGPYNQRYTGNDILAYANKRGMISELEFTNCSAHSNPTYGSIDNIFNSNRNSMMYITPTKDSSGNFVGDYFSMSFKVKLPVVSTTLGGLSMSFNTGGNFEECEIWADCVDGRDYYTRTKSNPVPNGWNKVVSLKIDDTFSYKFRSHELNYMGKVQNLKFVFKCKSSSGQVQFKKLVMYDMQNIGYIPNADNMMLIDSENGKPYKITVENGTLKVNEINNSN